jgi:hypothetical protein
MTPSPRRFTFKKSCQPFALNLTHKQRLKSELYKIFLNTPSGKLTEPEQAQFHYLAVDDDVLNAIRKGVRRDYAAMCRANKMIPKTYQAMTAMVRAGRLRLKKNT